MLFQHILRLPYHVAVRGFGFNANCTFPVLQRRVPAHNKVDPDAFGSRVRATGVPGLRGSLGLCSLGNSVIPRRICSASRLVKSSVTSSLPAALCILGQRSGVTLRTLPKSS